MGLALRVGQVDLTKTQEHGLVCARESVWRLATNRASLSIKNRGLPSKQESRCLQLLETLSSRRAAVSADKAAGRLPGSKPVFLTSHRGLKFNFIPVLMSKEINKRLIFLSSYKSPSWSSQKLKEASHIMANVFRSLLLCQCAWMQKIPVAVIAAIVEVFVADSKALIADWWLDKEHCGRVRQRAFMLCGSNVDAAMTDSVRASFVLLVLGMRYAKRLSNRCRIGSEGCPFGGKKLQSLPRAAKRCRFEDDGEDVCVNRFFLTENEVRMLLAVVKKVEWYDAYDRVRADLDMQCAIVRAAQEGGDWGRVMGDRRAEVNEWCYFCEETGEIQVSCATGMVMEILEVVQTLGSIATTVKRSERYQNLVKSLCSDGKAMSFPFLLAQVLTEGLEVGVTEANVQILTEELLKRISSDGRLQAVRRGPKKTKRRRA